MQIPTFVVGLERHKTKYQAVINRLAEAGIEAQLWRGVDGWQPIQLEKDEKVNNSVNWVLRFKPFTNTELGCFLSHYRLMKHALKERWDRVAVVEDDVFFKNNTKDVFNILSNLDQSFEYINFGCYRLHKTSGAHHSYDIGNGFKLFRPTSRLYGTIAYMVSLQGLEKLVPFLANIKREIDTNINDAFYAGVRGFVLAPNVVMTSKKKDDTNIRRPNRQGLLARIYSRMTKPFIKYVIDHRKKHVILPYLELCEREKMLIDRYNAQKSPNSKQGDKV